MTTKKKKLICYNCEEEIDQQDQHYIHLDKDKFLCSNCRQEAKNGICSKLFIFSTNNKEEGFKKILFNDKINFTELTTQPPKPILKLEYTQIDGWRGYYEAKLAKNYIKLIDGWIANLPDETTQRKIELNEYFEALTLQKIAPPATLYWLFMPTSNVFSQGSSLIIHQKDQEKIENWLKEINGGIKHFKYMLS